MSLSSPYRLCSIRSSTHIGYDELMARAKVDESCGRDQISEKRERYPRATQRIDMGNRRSTCHKDGAHRIQVLEEVDDCLDYRCALSDLLLPSWSLYNISIDMSPTHLPLAIPRRLRCCATTNSSERKASGSRSGAMDIPGQHTVENLTSYSPSYNT